MEDTAGRVAGKVAIVTGAASGIGRAAARMLAAEGARVVVADVADAGQEVADDIERAGGDAAFVRTDVTSGEQVRALVDGAVARWGGLDVLVNNAALAIGGSAGEIDEETWQRVLDVNLSGVWRGMRWAIPHMLEHGGGSVVNVSSVQSLVGFVGWAGYAASKGGINALTQQAAIEYAPRGIRVNAIVPGTILTGMNEGILTEVEDPDALMAEWVSMHPVGRIGTPEEVAPAIVYLASDESAFVTGGEVVRVRPSVASTGDATGAGDVFAGSFAASHVLGVPL
ncbi:MAG TPA: SDR family oxidoreductase, partial [Actinomycetota bacterium]|nr:SDR family oxidoreductase [Actinomycetota bacterium]